MGNRASNTNTGATNATGGQHGGKANVNRKTSAWRSSFLSPLLYFLGTCLWLAGAACLVAEQPRDGWEVDGGKVNTATILFIIGSSLFILGALVSLASAYAEVALLKVGGRVPGIGRLLILSAWHELLGSILLLIGSALFLSAGSVSLASAGAILWLIGGFIYLLGMLVLTVLALVVASVTSLMPEMLHRQRSWFSIASTLIWTVGWIFFVIGAAATVVLRGPGFLLFAGLLWLVATSLWFFSFIVRMCGSWYYFVPILSFATAAAATSGLVAGTAGQAGVTAGHMGATKTVDTMDSKATDGRTGNTTAHLVTTSTASDTRRPSGTAPTTGAGNVQAAV